MNLASVFLLLVFKYSKISTGTMVTLEILNLQKERCPVDPDE